MQRLLVTGNLTADAESQPSGDTQHALNFTIADNTNDYKDANGEKVSQPEFFRCVRFLKDPEKLKSHLLKGKLVSIVGRLKTSSYEKEGEKKYSTQVIVDELEFH